MYTEIQVTVYILKLKVLVKTNYNKIEKHRLNDL